MEWYQFIGKLNNKFNFLGRNWNIQSSASHIYQCKNKASDKQVNGQGCDEEEEARANSAQRFIPAWRDSRDMCCGDHKLLFCYWLEQLLLYSEGSGGGRGDKQVCYWDPFRSEQHSARIEWCDDEGYASIPFQYSNGIELVKRKSNLLPNAVHVTCGAGVDVEVDCVLTRKQ